MGIKRIRVVICVWSRGSLASNGSSSTVIDEWRSRTCRTYMTYISTLTKTRIIVVGLLLVHAATIVKPVQMPVDKPESADKPAPRADRNSVLAHSELLEKGKQGRIDVYFEGDSITRRWGTSDEQYQHFLRNW